MPVRYAAVRGVVPLLDEAIKAHKTGELEAAARAYELCLARHPACVDAWMNLGALHCRAGRAEEAACAFERAVALASGDARVLRDVGIGFNSIGRLSDAAAALERSVARDPHLVGSWLHLARTRLEVSEPATAIAAAKRAVELQPTDPSAHFVLGRCAFNECAETATLALQRASELGYVEAAAFRWLLSARAPGLRDLSPRVCPLSALAATPAQGALADAVTYLRERLGGAPLFASARDTLRFAAANAPPAGCIVELGVFHGTSLRWLLEARPGAAHGFDSFLGLPAAWDSVPRGMFTTAGRTPAGLDCTFWVGLFADQLPLFAAQQRDPVALLHVDSDLYESARCGLQHLAPLLGPGSVIVFDEYVGHTGWRNDEFRAFEEATAANAWRYEYLAANPFTGQVVVRLLGACPLKPFTGRELTHVR